MQLKITLEYSPMNPPKPTSFAIYTKDEVTGKIDIKGWLELDQVEKAFADYQTMKNDCEKIYDSYRAGIQARQETERDSQVPADVQAKGGEAAQGKTGLQEEA